MLPVEGCKSCLGLMMYLFGASLSFCNQVVQRRENRFENHTFQSWLARDFCFTTLIYRVGAQGPERVTHLPRANCQRWTQLQFAHLWAIIPALRLVNSLPPSQWQDPWWFKFHWRPVQDFDSNIVIYGVGVQVLIWAQERGQQRIWQLWDKVLASLCAKPGNSHVWTSDSLSVKWGW